MTTKKAQAAMEFLLTYGWAIVVVVTGMGVWGYYFDFYPVKNGMAFRPETCTLEIGLSCLDHRLYLYDDGFDRYNELQLSVKNNVGQDIRITQVDFPAYGRSFITDIPLANGENNELNAFTIDDVTNFFLNPSAPILENGEAYSLDFTISFENTATGLVHTYAGKIVGKVG